MNKFTRIQLNIIIMMILVMLSLIIAIPAKHNAKAAQDSDSKTYLPVIHNPKIYPIPQVDRSIVLPGALCPHDASYNELTGHLYVINAGSSDVSIVHNEQWQGNVHVGGRPTSVDVNPNTGIAYVSNFPEPPPPGRTPETPLLRPCGDPYGEGRDPACISIFNGSTLVSQIDPRHEPFDTVVNPANGYAYITDLDSAIHVLDTTTLIATPRIETPAHGLSGWPLSIAHDLSTGLTYMPSWEYGYLYIMDGLNVIDSFSYQGWGAEDIAIDNANGYIYITNSQTSVDGRPSNNISVLTRGSHAVAQHYTASSSRYIAINQATGYAYVVNPKDNSITILRNGIVVTTLSVPGQPWDVEVNQLTGFAFVTLKDDHKVVIFKEDAIVATLDTNSTPLAIGIDEVNGATYIVNRKSTTAYDEFGRPYEVCLDNPTVMVLR